MTELYINENEPGSLGLITLISAISETEMVVAGCFRVNASVNTLKPILDLYPNAVIRVSEVA